MKTSHFLQTTALFKLQSHPGGIVAGEKGKTVKTFNINAILVGYIGNIAVHKTKNGYVLVDMYNYNHIHIR